MKILQTVTVKQILTESSKKSLLNKYNHNKLQLKKECDQLLFELKKLERTRKYSSNGLKTQFDKELDKRKEKIKLIDFQIDQLDLLPLGSELKDQDVQALIDINIGDSWDDIIKGKTVIIQDGIVTEIRE
ncbi:YlqD family protein [Lederbergia citrea]|uniref:YlqD family protein n=1 Tax=Lederbergia citrea TaxID=2833581 RepID=A0A942UMF5_9BACI|nr:YlqD family protein [Lederbergia citrea]MBS4177146.1 YlqD family protein [Lederbergia citrea]MBS4203809.1 YlqD family protein [Lederbergia citrea]MBS4221606.1 YlqD family protein [Lederbergia citrea]